MGSKLASDNTIQNHAYYTNTDMGYVTDTILVQPIREGVTSKAWTWMLMVMWHAASTSEGLAFEC